MKKKNGGSLTVEASFYLDSKANKRGFVLPIQFITMLAGVCGGLFCFLSCIKISCNYGLAAFTAAAFTALSAAIFSLSEKYFKIVFPSVTAVSLFGAFLFRYRISAGLAGVINAYVSRVYADYRNSEIIPIPDGLNMRLNTNILMIFTLFFACLAIGYGIIYRNNIVIVLLLTALPVELCLLYGLVPNYAAFASVLACWASLFAVDLSEPDFVAGKGSAFKKNPCSKACAQCGFAAAAAVTASFIAAQLIVSASGYTRPERIEGINRSVTDYFEQTPIEQIVNDVRTGIPISFGGSSINHGKLGTEGNITFTHSEALRVTMPKVTETTYLRGFVGSVYSGSSWDELSGSKLDELDELASRFSTSGLNPLMFDGFSLKTRVEAFGEFMPKSSFRITNIGANDKYMYLPYNLVPESVSRYEITNYSRFEGGESNWFGQYYDVSVFAPHRSILNGNWFSPDANLTNDETEYRRFVYDNYLDVPENFKSAEVVFDRNYYDYITAEPNPNGKSVLTDNIVWGRKLQYIKTWLRNHCAYDLNVGRLPSGEDFADYFITETRKGSCSHFATSAVLLCRWAGIPARYVEGYVIKPGDFPSEAPLGASETVEVTDARGHAWAEIYIDRFGWYPIEFTSGYGNVRTAEPIYQQEENAEAPAAAGGAQQSSPPAETDLPPPPAVPSAGAAVPPAAESAQTGNAAATPAGTPSGITEAADDNEPIPPGGGEHNKIAKRLKFFIPFILSAAIAALIALRRAVSLKSYKLSLSGDTSRAAAFIYKKFSRLVKIMGFEEMGDMGYEEYAGILENGSPVLSGGEAKTVIDAALRAAFGGGIDGAGIKRAYSAERRAAMSYYGSLKLHKKFYVKFILCLL